MSATYPPFESMDANNQIVGFDIDLAHALCKQMQADCTFTNHAFDSLIPALKFKKYDAVISGMDITPERSKQVAFTDPYYANSALVIAKKDAFHSFDDFKGKRIGMENGTTHQKYLQDKHPEVKTVAYDSYQNAIIDLKMAVSTACSATRRWSRVAENQPTAGGSHAESNRSAILRHRPWDCRAPG